MRVQRPQINQDIDWDNFPPEHPVCEVQVEVPTLRLQQRGHGYPHRPPEFEGQEEIVVQWFGDNSRGNLKEKNLQFAFPLMTKLDSVHWFGRPEWYRTVMLGALKGWPNKEALTKMVEDGRSPDEVVIYVVTSQIGLDDGHGHTLEETGQEFGVTRERIRQIEAKALMKLRKHRESKKLQDYLR